MASTDHDYWLNHPPDDECSGCPREDEDCSGGCTLEAIKADLQREVSAARWERAHNGDGYEN